MIYVRVLFVFTYLLIIREIGVLGFWGINENIPQTKDVELYLNV